MQFETNEQTRSVTITGTDEELRELADILDSRINWDETSMENELRELNEALAP